MGVPERSEKSQTDLPSELKASESWFTSLGNWVRSSTILLFGYFVVGVIVTGACLWAGGQTRRADPTSACHLRTDGSGFVTPSAAPGVGQPGAKPPGILALEFAGKGDAAKAIVDRWAACTKTPGASVSAGHHALDLDTTLFIPLYVVTVAWWCLHVGWAAYRRSVRRSAVMVMVAVLFAGLLDEIENVALNRVIAGDGGTWATIATAVTVPKWLILAIAVPVAICGFAGVAWNLTERVFRPEGMRPVFYGPLSDGDAPVVAPLGPDQPEPDRMRRRRLDPHGQPWPDNKVGICLSGGGIRSASFGLGVLQALQVPGPGEAASIYETADYLATVSGGGYTGTATQILAHQHPDGAPPLKAGSDEADRIRTGRRYLWGSPEPHYRWHSTREFVSGVTMFVAGIIVNVAVVVSCLYALSHPLGWLARFVIFGGGARDIVPHRHVTPGLIGGFVLAPLVLLTILLLARRGSPEPGALWGYALLKIALLTTTLAVIVAHGFWSWYWLVIPLTAGVAGSLGHWCRQRLKAAGLLPAGPPGPQPKLFAITGGWALGGLAVTSAWYWTDQAFARGTAAKVEARPVVAILVAIVGMLIAILVGAAIRIPLDAARRRGVTLTTSTILLYLGVAFAFGVGAGTAIVLLGALRATADGVLGSDVEVWAAIAASLAVVYLFGDQKWWSPHPVYKRRLARTFALTRYGPIEAGTQRSLRLPYRVRTTLSEWAAKPPKGPELLICAAVYDSVEQRADLLQAWPFVFSHRHVGGSDVGWVRTVDFEAVLGRNNQPDGTLQAAMAISGAAVSPAIGRISLGSANALIATANLRLGVWLPSPRSIELMRRATPPVPAWVRARRITYLLKEICGGYDLNARLVYVTDGGQFDNLGLFELLARHCATIYCFDASGDLKPGKKLTTKAFDETREMARRRLGVVFSLPDQATDGTPPTPTADGDPTNPDALTSGFVTEDDFIDWPAKPRVKVAQCNVTVLEIHYPDGSGGTLVYGKCVLTAAQAGTVAQKYAIDPVGRHRFPADSTADQWLDDHQFDAYVDLGTSVGRRAIEVAGNRADVALGQQRPSSSSALHVQVIDDRCAQ